VAIGKGVERVELGGSGAQMADGGIRLEDREARVATDRGGSVPSKGEIGRRTMEG
jgi:hypothetical protein